MLPTYVSCFLDPTQERCLGIKGCTECVCDPCSKLPTAVSTNDICVECTNDDQPTRCVSSHYDRECTKVAKLPDQCPPSPANNISRKGKNKLITRVCQYLLPMQGLPNKMTSMSVCTLTQSIVCLPFSSLSTHAQVF